ncbi:MAG: ATP-binding protein, partial [Gemmatimonadales bacterium]
ARRDEIKEVLVNLLENARNADASRIVVRVEARTLSVLDNGRGIPGSQVPHVFEPRFSTTTSGSGLGLAIVRRLVESWGARVEVVSERRKGTEVRVVFQGPENRE